MDRFFLNYEIWSFWMVTIFSFLVAYIFKRAKLLDITKLKYRSKVIKTIYWITGIVCVFIFIDHIILRYLLHLYFKGPFTDWKIYLFLFFILDISLISPYYYKSELSNDKFLGVKKLSTIYFAFRFTYIISIFLRVFFIGFFSGGAFSTTDLVYPRKDAKRSIETHVFNNLILLSTKPDGFSAANVGLEIYLNALGIFKRKIYTVIDETHGSKIPYEKDGLAFIQRRDSAFFSGFYIAQLSDSSVYIFHEHHHPTVKPSLKWYKADNTQINTEENTVISVVSGVLPDTTEIVSKDNVNG